MSDMLRVTGITSGIDTDSVISGLMKIEQMKIDKVEQDKILLGWEQDAYKEITNQLRDFQDTYFDYLNPDSNLRSSSLYNVYSAGISVNGTSSSAVSITTTSSATLMDKTIESIDQLASRDTWSSTSKVAGDLTGTLATTTNLLSAGEFTLSVDGTEKTIALTGGYIDDAALETEIEAQLAGEFSFGINVTVAGGEISFDTGAEGGHILSVTGTDAVFTELGFTSGDSNILNSSASLADAFGITTDQTISINEESFTFTSDMTVADMMTEINNSDANVTISYSQVSDTFSFISNDTGVVNNIDLVDDTTELAGGFFADALKLDGATRDIGVDAIFSIDGISTSRSSNTFLIDGLQITLNETYNDIDPIDIKISTDNVDDVVDTLVAFVDKFNTIIETINNKLGESKNYDYRPLSSEEKEVMTEDDIELWEDQAKSGLLRGDSILSRMSTSLRTMVYEMTDGVNISLSDIGISTSSNYLDSGKLVVDEMKLKTALIENPSEVMELFTKESDTEYSDGENRPTRYEENGFAYRIYDMLQDNIRTTRDDDGYKGLLIEKAGVEGDSSEFTNDMFDKITRIDLRIDDLLEAMMDKEEYYYRMFGNMETILTQLEAEGNAFLGQLG